MEKFNILWSRYDGKFSCVVGHLEYNDDWTFYYDEEGIKVAQNLGFILFPEFPDINEIYTSKKLFSTFDLRIRRNNQNINEEEKIHLLTESEGRLETDNVWISNEKALIKGR